jgi:hypothetical protein
MKFRHDILNVLQEADIPILGNIHDMFLSFARDLGARRMVHLLDSSLSNAVRISDPIDVEINATPEELLEAAFRTHVRK